MSTQFTQSKSFSFSEYKINPISQFDQSYATLNSEHQKKHGMGKVNMLADILMVSTWALMIPGLLLIGNLAGFR